MRRKRRAINPGYIAKVTFRGRKFAALGRTPTEAKANLLAKLRMVAAMGRQRRGMRKIRKIKRRFARRKRR